MTEYRLIHSLSPLTHLRPGKGMLRPHLVFSVSLSLLNILNSSLSLLNISPELDKVIEQSRTLLSRKHDAP